MARTMRSPKIETRSSRLKLAIAKRPYWAQIGKGISLGYRRNQGPGTWSIRVAHSTGHWSQVIGTADDYAESNAGDVLTYWEAASKARTLGTNAPNGGGGGQLGTVGRHSSLTKRPSVAAAGTSAMLAACARIYRRHWRRKQSQL